MTEKRNMQVGFIHLPYESGENIGQNVFSMPLSDMVKALRSAIVACALPDADSNLTKKG